MPCFLLTVPSCQLYKHVCWLHAKRASLCPHCGLYYAVCSGTGNPLVGGFVPTVGLVHSRMFRLLPEIVEETVLVEPKAAAITPQCCSIGLGQTAQRML